MPELPKMSSGNCFGPALRPASFEAPEAPQMKEKADERRAAFEAQQAERQAAMEARLEEMKQAMEERRAAGNCETEKKS